MLRCWRTVNQKMSVFYSKLLASAQSKFPVIAPQSQLSEWVGATPLPRHPDDAIWRETRVPKPPDRFPLNRDV